VSCHFELGIAYHRGGCLAILNSPSSVNISKTVFSQCSIIWQYYYTLCGGGGIYLQNSVPSALLEVSFFDNFLDFSQATGRDVYDLDDHAGMSLFLPCI
jgi:hypothetical protein